MSKKLATGPKASALVTAVHKELAVFLVTEIPCSLGKPDAIDFQLESGRAEFAACVATAGYFV